MSDSTPSTPEPAEQASSRPAEELSRRVPASVWVGWVVVSCATLLVMLLVAWLAWDARDELEKERRFQGIVPVKSDFPVGTLDAYALELLQVAEEHHQKYREHRELMGKTMTLAPHLDIAAYAPVAEGEAEKREATLVELGWHLAHHGQKVQGVRLLRLVCRRNDRIAARLRAETFLRALGEKVPKS